MWSKIKDFFQNIGLKIKPYLGYMAVILVAVIGIILLGRKPRITGFEEFKKAQEERTQKAEQIMQETGQILDSADSKIENYFENNKKRWEEGKYE